MTDNTNMVLYALLRQALGIDESISFSSPISNDEWQMVYLQTVKQSVRGIVYDAVKQLSKEYSPPTELMMKWTMESENIGGLNRLLNDEAVRLTKLFAHEGRKTAVLKGQANARLYPNPLSRHAGDIDLWVEGGRESVCKLINSMGLANQELLKNKTSYHHVHLKKNKNGVTVEIHFRPSSGNHNPITNRRLQRYLEGEILKSEPCTEGFCVPTIPFALVMQMSHIQRHFLAGGIGMRQIIDYYELLTHSTAEDRATVAEKLKAFGLRKSASAVMWVLQEVLHMSDDCLLTKPDSRRGQRMLKDIMSGGNFGWYVEWRQDHQIIQFLKSKRRSLCLLNFEPLEIVMGELNWLKAIAQTIPTRIKYRHLFLRNVKELIED